MVGVEVDQVLLDCIPHLLVLCDPSGYLLLANERWRDFVDKKEETTASWLSLVHPDDEKKTKERWESHVTLPVMFEVTHRLKSSTGDFRYYIFYFFFVSSLSFPLFTVCAFHSTLL